MTRGKRDLVYCRRCGNCGRVMYYRGPWLVLSCGHPLRVPEPDNQMEFKFDYGFNKK